MTARLRINSWILPALVLAALILQIIDPSRAWKTLLVVLGGALLFGWLWARGLAKGLHFTREMRYGWAQVGDELEERFTLQNDSVFPATWVEIDDASNMPDYHASLATAVGSNGHTEFLTHGQCSRRGLYTLGGTIMQSGDPLGIFTVRIEDPASQSLLVLPPVVPLPSIDVTPGGFFGSGRPRSHSPEQSVAAAGVREYVPGDPLRLIHWPTTARHAKPYVRLLDGTPSADWWVLLDLDAASQVGTGWDSTEEHSVVLAASLADRALKSHKAVGLAVNGQQLSWRPPRANQEQRWVILQDLALARQSAMDLKRFLQRSGRSFGRQCSLVIITANTTPGWIEALSELQWRGTVIPTIMLVDPASFGGEGRAGEMTAELQHMGISCHIITRELLDRPEAHPGHAGQWEWRTSATGKAIPIRKPVETGWKKLA
ncbi:MAG TPA: DUF58 domain-containing protein [Anaerolineales bacterium]|jgi:uncharacterized protein (DUF58 family)